MTAKDIRKDTLLYHNFNSKQLIQTCLNDVTALCITAEFHQANEAQKVKKLVFGGLFILILQMHVSFKHDTT